MELGEKLRNARMEAGLSQRQLCDGIITRNMLSQIENGSARPSMKSLSALAQRLGKSVSFFLEETAVLSPNQSVMESVRRLYDGGEYPEAALVLEAYRQPDPVYDREKAVLECLILLELARQALERGKAPYARELLEKAQTDGIYCGEALERQRLLLLGQVPGQPVSHRLPALDEELLLRAREALAEGSVKRAARLLDAAEDQRGGSWNLLRGMVYMSAKNWKSAVRCLEIAWTQHPRETVPLLEVCFRELGDYQKAYEYALMQRE